jgi:hypothetical protein
MPSIYRYFGARPRRARRSARSPKSQCRFFVFAEDLPYWSRRSGVPFHIAPVLGLRGPDRHRCPPCRASMGRQAFRCSMGQLLRTKRHTATGKQSPVLVAAVIATCPPHLPRATDCGSRMRTSPRCRSRHRNRLTHTNTLASMRGGLLAATLEHRPEAT